MQTATATTTLTAAQFARAYRLARAYGHLWATCWPENDVDRTVSVEEIKANTLVVDADSTWQGFSILAPDVRMVGPDDDMIEVVHTTTLGRLEWVVNELGGVVLTVRRPGGVREQGVDVLSAYVDSDDNVVEIMQPDAYLTTQRRHEALSEALHALGVVEGFLALVGMHENEESDYDRTPGPLIDVLTRLRIAPTCVECVVVRVYDDGTVVTDDMMPIKMDSDMARFGDLSSRRRSWRENGTTAMDTLRRAVATDAVDANS